jgi:uncharacterized protein
VYIEDVNFQPVRAVGDGDACVLGSATFPPGDRQVDVALPADREACEGGVSVSALFEENVHAHSPMVVAKFTRQYGREVVVVGSGDVAVDLLEQDDVGVVATEDGCDPVGAVQTVDSDGFVNVVGQESKTHESFAAVLITCSPSGGHCNAVIRCVLHAAWLACTISGTMASDDIRKRLERLNRGPLGDLLRPASEVRAPVARRRPVDLEAVLPGRVGSTELGEFYAIERDPSVAWKAASGVSDRLNGALADPVSRVRAEGLHADLAALVDARSAGWLFVDLETCGFAGTPVFLIGTMYLEGGRLRTDQLLARSYAEEACILTRLAELMVGRTHLVTFNGKSFDWPFVSDRASVSRVTLPSLTGHCDLLHVARRRFKSILPDCKLQTLERYICGWLREGDIPGSEIPTAYHSFVLCGDARPIRDVVHHNFLDLVTMADVLSELLHPRHGLNSDAGRGR